MTMSLFRQFHAGQPIGYACNPAEKLLDGLGVIHLGFLPTDMILLDETMHLLGARDVVGSEQVYPIERWKPGFFGHDCLVINIDRYADLETGITHLMNFRRAFASCSVVLATAGVASDEFGHHRRAICDSTLKLPLSASRLRDALEAALVNHSRASF